MPSIEKPFSLEANDERVIAKMRAGNTATPSDKVTTPAKASSRGRDSSNDTKLSAVAAQISQKSTSQKVWDAMPWGAVVGLALAVVGGVVMLIGVTLFNAYPMWDRGDHTMSMLKRQLQQVMEQLACQSVADFPAHLVKG